MANPVRLIADHDQKILIFRVVGAFDPPILVASLLAHLCETPQARAYHHIFDCRNLEGPLLDAQSLKGFADHWRALADPPGAGLRTAHVRRRGLCQHPLETELSRVFREREMGHFSDFDEALDWVRAAVLVEMAL